MPLRFAGGLDLAAGALIIGGAGLLAASLIAVVVLRAPPTTSPASALPAQTNQSGSGPLAVLPADRVATILNLDTFAGAGGAARPGDRVDVLGYFPHQITGTASVTRVLVADVPVLAADRAGTTVALTLAVAPDAALGLQEAQARGARPFVALRSARASIELPLTFSDTDLANRLASAP